MLYPTDRGLLYVVMAPDGVFSIFYQGEYVRCRSMEERQIWVGNQQVDLLIFSSFADNPLVFRIYTPDEFFKAHPKALEWKAYDDYLDWRSIARGESLASQYCLGGPYADIDGSYIPNPRTPVPQPTEEEKDLQKLIMALAAESDKSLSWAEGVFKKEQEEKDKPVAPEVDDIPF